MIDRVFVTHDEVSEVIAKHPGPSIGIIPPQDPASRKVRQGIPGGYSEAKVEDTDVKEIASFAASQIAAKDNSGPLKIIEISSAATQVVAGKNYKLVLKLADNKNDNPQTCEVVVFDQSWTSTRELKSSTCNPAAATPTKTKREDIKLEEAVASDPQTNKPISLVGKATEPRSIVIEIQEALAKRDDTGRISDYIGMSSEELKKALPSFKEGNRLK